MENERSSFVRRMEQEMLEWQEKLDRLRVQAHLGSMETKERVAAAREDLQRRIQNARRELERIREATGEAWYELSTDLERGWSEFKERAKRAVAAFKE